MVIAEHKYNSLLSICIPTFNRCDRLKQTLEIMIDKVKEFNICFFISDNASTDNTGKVINDLKMRYPHIVYSRNNQNVGFDRNLEIALKISDTKYRWIFGDDDYLDYGSILEIFESINSNYDLIVLNRNKGNDNRIYTEMKDLFIDLSASMTWISTLILSEEIIFKSDFIKFYDTSFIHIGIIFSYLAKKKSRVINLTRIVIKQSLIKTNGYANSAFTIFILDLYQVIHELPDFYSLKEKRDALRLHTKEFSNYFYLPLTARLNNEINIKYILKYKKQINEAFPFFWKVYVYFISIFPNWLLSISWKSWKTIKSKLNL